jgi:hypothetical protein
MEKCCVLVNVIMGILVMEMITFPAIGNSIDGPNLWNEPRFNQAHIPQGKKEEQ